jgi:general secretion pathway protein E
MGLPFTFARRCDILVENAHGSEAEVVVGPRVTRDAVIEVRRALGRPIRLRRVAADEFARRLQHHYEHGGASSEEAMADIGESLDLDQLAHELHEPGDLLEAADDAPIIRFINALLAEAIREEASDIHLEPYESRFAIRLRVDGVMREVLQPPLASAPLITSRIKVMAKLDIAEKRLPQDGRISLRVANRPVDVRVSTFPSGHGERVVLRLLDKQAGRLELEQLGMDHATMTKLDEVIHRPHGILLITGPTGSGKTTTLYAALSRLNDRSRNVMTVEDPIEYFIEGIAQTQVNPKVGMSFARGLRAMLRQDPDVVMVGEIRDLETAQIAVQASLTGHLVFSTLHTNTAIGAVTRLRDMGTEPFLLASSLAGVLAQHLVRLLCPRCKKPGALDMPTAVRLGFDLASAVRIFVESGCPECRHAGFRGRSAIFELIVVDDPLRRLIHDGASELELERHARENSASILEAGHYKLLQGLTAPGELLRVTKSL